MQCHLLGVAGVCKMLQEKYSGLCTYTQMTRKEAVYIQLEILPRCKNAPVRLHCACISLIRLILSGHCVALECRHARYIYARGDV